MAVVDATRSELFDWQVRYIDIYLFYVYGLRTGRSTDECRDVPLIRVDADKRVAPTADAAVAATRPKLADRHSLEVAVELGQVGVDAAVRPDASQLDGVFRTRARLLVLGRILHTVVTLGDPACRPCATAIIINIIIIDIFTVG